MAANAQLQQHHRNSDNNNNNQIRARRVGLDLLKECGERLRQGDLVAFPTETVYGLGGNAMNEAACRKIFEAKERPLTDPLIVHVTDPQRAFDLWNATAAAADDDDENDPKISSLEARVLRHLCRVFWPGPLTLVAKASSTVPPVVMAGTGYVACRSPNHVVARALIDAAQVPLAAPSANKFGHVSPTTADHVWDDLQHEKVWILEPRQENDEEREAAAAGATCQVGVESSVVKLEQQPQQSGDNNKVVRLTMLRQGAVSVQQLEAALFRDSSFDPSLVEVVSKSKTMQKSEIAAVAPGQTLRHYSPNVESFLLSSFSQQCRLPTFGQQQQQQQQHDNKQEQEALMTALLSTSVLIDYGQVLLAWKDQALAYRDMSETGSSAEAAQHVFETLRWAESVPGAKRILFSNILDSVSLHDDALALAVKDRLTRAASGKVIESMEQLLSLSSSSSSSFVSTEEEDDDEPDLFDVEPKTLLSDTSPKAQATLELQSYWQKWLENKLTLDETVPHNGESDFTKSVITAWRNDKRGEWYCYWDEEEEDKEEKNFVFQPPLERSRSGIVRPLHWDWTTDYYSSSPRELYQPLQALLDIAASYPRPHQRLIHWGDESDGEWQPFIMPWHPAAAVADNNADNNTLSPQTLLQRLGAHDELIRHVCELPLRNNEDDDDDDDGYSDVSGLEAIQQFLDQHGTDDKSVLVFYAGSERLNPVPCFAVAQVRPDLVAGFIGGVVHT